MNAGAPLPDESPIRTLCEAGDHDAATARTLETYGAEVFRYLVAVHRDQDEADDAYGMFMEKLLSTLPSFRWQCSMRSWSYLLARNASAEVRRGIARQRALAFDTTRWGQVAARVRSETMSILRTEKRTALEELYVTLSSEDRELIVLRLTHGMSWREVALLTAGKAELDEQALAVESARVRKRYQLLRTRLRKLGKERGLL